METKTNLTFPQYAADAADCAHRDLTEVTDPRVQESFYDDSLWPSYHVPFSYLRVSDFSDPALRVAVARYWTPNFVREEGQKDLLREALARAEKALGFDDDLVESLWAFHAAPLRVEVMIDGYCNAPWSHVTVLAEREVGRIFPIAHDMYQQVYALDQGGEHDSELLNRGFGSHVWGHELGDLSFAYAMFNPNRPGLPKEALEGGPHFLGTFRFSLNS